MDKVYETKDYSKFELHEFNRSLKGIDRLIGSMRNHGWLSAYPMHVVRNGNNKLKIKAGHHRFEAARALGISVKYVICDDDSTIHELERSTIGWTTRDYLESYARIGNPNYCKLSEFYNKYKIPVSVSASLLGGTTANFGCGTITNRLKSGDFKVSNPTHAYDVGEMVLFLDDIGVEFCRNSRFIVALSKVMLVDGVNQYELKNKMNNHIYMMKKQPDVNSYITMLESIYNRQRAPSKKLPIAINAL